MPESPAAVRKRYLDMDLPIADVLILTDEKPFSRYYDAVLEAGAPVKLAANWVLGDVMAYSKVCHPCGKFPYTNAGGLMCDCNCAVWGFSAKSSPAAEMELLSFPVSAD